METEKKELPRMVVFVNSALGYNEIRMLREFESSYQMVYVSHNFTTHTQYLNLLNQATV